RTDKQTLASYSFMRANLKAKNRIAVDARQTSRPSSQSFFQWLRASEAPSAMALQSRAPADLPCRSNGEFMPHARQSSGSLSSRAGLEGSWLERQWQTK